MLFKHRAAVPIARNTLIRIKRYKRNRIGGRPWYSRRRESESLERDSNVELIRTESSRSGQFLLPSSVRVVTILLR